MLRIHFTPDDLARIRISADPHPLWEVLLSTHLLQTQQGALMFGGWRRQARAALPAAAKLVMMLARPKGYSPDFLTPAVPGGDLDTLLDHLVSTPRPRLRGDLTMLAKETSLPAWMAQLADGQPDMMRQLRNGILQYHAAVLGPHWSAVQSYVRADWSQRAANTMAHGFEHVLSTLHPSVRWQAPILEVDYPVDRDIYLRGRGLTLIPSFFCWQNLITLADEDQQPVLVYPVERDLDWTQSRPDLATEQLFPPRPKSLNALLGRTRAIVLQTIADTPHLNTTELARTIGISLAGASQHATVLRDAGLVVTFRHNGFAVHKLSLRGARLLERPGYFVTV